jgi:hypothetical protein
MIVVVVMRLRLNLTLSGGRDRTCEELASACFHRQPREWMLRKISSVLPVVKRIS